ncbi:unnamed protein product [Didymodactylos carnosus]|uniref:uridine/cytidine kinase n=1 Tax=Didymodactylos carnosus TaxID=1234261 RepID=A0A814BNZ6_9BILA|nr:unnamed protein product [Didymodactylos carnosus]CAF0943440.1 unnamed protein product [Didymodactylos carnosus]CAF3707491.1 unnamed protein product [Didymodactylos carnosus]CAF3718245.1 unnamed protein product [Didymodactylos carnosus]
MSSPPVKPFLIGVAGGPCSGKSTVCEKIVKDLECLTDNQANRVAVIALEHFYRPKSAEQRVLATRGDWNLDHPVAFDDELLFTTLQDLLNGKTVRINRYDVRTFSHIDGEYENIEPVDVIIMEGILVFYFPQIRDLFNMKLFVDTDADTRLARRVLRDMKLHGRNLEHILNSYTNYVKPAFEDFCLPTKKYADVIIPRGADNSVAVDLIVQHIKDFLKQNTDMAVQSPLTQHWSLIRYSVDIHNSANSGGTILQRQFDRSDGQLRLSLTSTQQLFVTRDNDIEECIDLWPTVISSVTGTYVGDALLLYYITGNRCRREFRVQFASSDTQKGSDHCENCVKYLKKLCKLTNMNDNETSGVEQTMSTTIDANSIVSTPDMIKLLLSQQQTIKLSSYYYSEPIHNENMTEFLEKYLIEPTFPDFVSTVYAMLESMAKKK